MTRRWDTAADAMERHQVAVYLAAITIGVLFGWVAPATGPGLEHVINPVLGALLYATFMQVPVTQLARSVRDWRFLTATMTVNFAVVPLVVAVMFWFLPANQAVQLGVLLVLLTPCVDYVIVFSKLAGGSSQRLLAATPLLLIAQMLLLPLFLLLFLGSALADAIDAGPFLHAFVTLIVIPLALAWVTQWWATRHRSGTVVARTAGIAMVPLMAATLFVVVASQVPKVRDDIPDVLAVAPFYVLFLIVMAVAGLTVTRLFRLDVPAARAVVFSGATRNSLVVLPLALALPDHLAVAAAVVVTQTLVEVVGMVAYVRILPRLLPAKTPPPERVSAA